MPRCNELGFAQHIQQLDFYYATQEALHQVASIDTFPISVGGDFADFGAQAAFNMVRNNKHCV